MPELIEVELYRRALEPVVGRRIVDVWAAPGYLRPDDPAGARARLVERRIAGTRRVGKLLLVELDAGGPIGLRFGMTGRLVVDGRAPIDSLLYAPKGDQPEWVRFRLVLDPGEVVVPDPRRLGSVELDPVPEGLGPDAATVTADQLAAALTGSSAPLKARLLDQQQVAGLGNLLVDECLFRAGVAPGRVASELDHDEIGRLASTIAGTIVELAARGGSHTGDLQPHREPGASCPLDGTALARERIGGRTTYWCPTHQR